MKKQFQSLTEKGRWLIATLTLLFTLGIGQMWGAETTKTYNFDDEVALSTDWDVTTVVPTNGTAICEITSSLSGAGFSAQDHNYLGLAYKDKSGITITITSKASYTNISNVALKVVAGDNSKPNFAAYIVTEDGDVEVFSAVGSKGGFGTGGTNKWGSKSVALSSAKTGKLKIVTYASSSGKYAAIDDIVITYTPDGGGDTPPAADTYTVKYKDGTTELYSESIEVGSHPAGITDPKKDCYEFAGWKNGTADVADVTALSGEKDEVITLQAQWTPLYVPQGSDYVFVNNAEVGTAPNKLTMTNGTTVNVTAGSRIDNIFFGAMAIKYESGATQSSGDDFKGWKINTNSATIKFLVENDSRVTITVGNLTSGCNIAYTNTSNTAQNVALAAKTANGYDVKGGSMVTLTTQGNKTVTLKGIAVSEVPALSDDATLSDLKVNGTTVAGFASGTQIYRTSVAYGTAVADMPKITGATATDANATVSDVQETFYDSDHGYYVSQVKVTAQNGTDYKFYQLRITVEPKLGVELIKALTSTDLTDGVGTATGYIGGKYYTNNGKGATKKLDSGKNYGLELKGDNTFDEGDLFVMNITTAAGATMGTMKLYESAEATDNLYESTNIGTTGLNGWALTDAVDAKNALFIKRGSGNDWNPTFSSIAVYRYMAPFIESFEIEGIGALTIDGTSITAEVSQNFDVTALTPTIKYWGNGGGAIDKTGAQDFTSPVTYTVSSAYAEDATGDYAPVTYTVTITKVVPSATPSITTQPASANYYEGATIAALEVVAEASDNGTLTYQWYLGADAIDGATEATYQPTVSEIGSYSYTCVVTNKKDDKPAASVTSNAAVIAIEDDPAAIKLLNGSTVNTTNFITGVTASKVTIGTTEYDCVAFAGTVGGVTSVKDLTRVVAYNATTTQTKVQLKLYNSNGNSRTIEVKGVVEGSTDVVNLASIDLTGHEQKTTEWIEFNNASNRTIYIYVSSNAGHIKILQTKVKESGDALKMAGEVGYSLNFNQGRFFGVKSTTALFEGLSVAIASSDCQPLSSSVVKVKENSMSFTAAAPVLLKVTTANNKTYYVANSTSGTTNETAKTGESEFNLAAGTWFINAGTSEVQFTKIEFAKPKAAKPVVADLANVEYCQGSAIDALTVSATVSDGGTMLYQWYKDGEIIAGAEAETYQPTADGEYYVEVVNTKAGYQNSDAVQSNTITVTGYAATVLSGTTGAENWPGEDATISVTASGKNLHYAWYTCDDAMGANPVAVDPAVDAAELDVTIAAADTYYKVVVSGDCGDAQEAVITVVARQAVELQDVTGDMSWDFSKANDGSAVGSNLCNDEVLANVHGIVNNSDFKSDNIKATANKFSSGKLQASMIMFHTTVGGIVTVVFSHTGNNKTDGRALVVNGTYQSELSHNQTAMTYKCYVPAGDVVLTSTTGDGGAMLNFTSVDFKAKAEADYTRNVSNNIGTLCVDHNVLVGGAMGATFYQIASRNELYNDKIDFEEVLPNEELKAGEPYIFHSNTGKIELFYGETVATEPVAVRGMIGSFVNTTLDITEENKSSIMYIAQNKLWNCEDLVVSDLEVVANRAYIVMSDVPTYAEYQEALQQQQNPAPRRRVTLGRNAEQVATGIGEVQGDKVQSTKVLIDGHIYILRGEKMFDAKGQLVK